jgi:Zn-dependent protease
MTVLIWLFLHPTAVAVCRRLTHRMANSMKSILLSFASLLALALLPFGSAAAETLTMEPPEVERPTGN